MEERLQHEIAHGKYLVEHGAGEVWNWESPAGKERWRRRVKMLTEFIPAGSAVLELGCGTGYFTKEIIKTGAKVTAIDISPDLLAVARKEVGAPNVVFMEENAYRMTFPDNHFDYIIGSSVLHHPDIPKALSEMFRMLKPGGRIAFTEPNMMNPQIAVQKNVPYVKRKLGDSPDETAFFRWRLRKLLRSYGFVDIAIRPFDFLHPATPVKMIPLISGIGMSIEKCLIIKEISGSLFIKASKQ